MKRPLVTLYGTLPPVIGMSEVSLELWRRLRERIKVEFISFKHLYPSFLHPAKRTIEEGRKPESGAKYIISWYNPLTPPYAALMGRGKIYHLQWWQPLIFPFYLPIMLRGRWSKRRIILQVHNVLPHESSPLSLTFTRMAFSLSHHFIVHNTLMRDRLIEEFSIAPERVHVIPFGYYGFYRKRRIGKEEARRKLGIKSRYAVLFFGNIREYKGLDLLIRAVADLVREGMDISLIVAGRPFGEAQTIVRSIREYGLEERALLNLDFIEEDEVQFYFEASDVVVLPYRRFDSLTGVGMVALSFEKPIIVSDVGALKDLVLDEDAVFRRGSHESLRDKLRIVLKEKLEKLKGDSRKVKEKFSWETTIEKLIHLYMEVKGEGGS